MNSDGTISGRATGIPFAKDCEHIAVVATGDKGTSDCPGQNRRLPRQRRPESRRRCRQHCDFRARQTDPSARPRLPVSIRPHLLLMGAIVRSVETAGALETILSLSVRYANERVAFERPIGKFQAVQQNLARLAGETAAALAAAGSAADTIAQSRRFRRRHCSLRPRRRKSAPAKQPRKAPPLRIRCMARSASPRNMCCIGLRFACCRGATISAVRAIGRPRSAT